MARTLFASEQQIAKIFSNDYAFTIPGYQRPYAWTKDNALELFDDLFSFMQSTPGPVPEKPPYFLGSIVLIKSEGSADAEVIDGQQRLTTLTILLSAIRENVPQKNAEEITALLYEKGNSILGTSNRYRLSLRDRDKSFFQEHIQEEGGFSKLQGLADVLPDAQNNMRINAQYFAEKLSALSETERLQLAQFIVTRCYLVVVATPDLNSAYRIFSVLNSRGLDLTATDILKARVVGQISEGLRDGYTKKWEDTEEELGREEFSDLFSHIRMVYRKAKPQGTLLKEFSENVSEVSQPATLIDSVVLPMAKAYGEMLSAAFESTAHAEEINNYLQWLNRIEYQDWVPPTLAFFVRYRQTPEKIRDFIKNIERLSYWMLVTRKGVNERIQRFSDITKEIESSKDLSNASSALQLTDIEKQEFSTILNGPIYESLSARARTTVLLKLDSLISGGGATYQYSRISVEHVLPQNPKPASKWFSWFPVEQDRLLWTHRLGNLALLTRNKNSSASNYEFDVKKTAYFSKGGVSPFPLTTQVLKTPEWTQAIVQSRQTDLLKTLQLYWQLV